MPRVAVYDSQGRQVEEVALSDEVFAVPVTPTLHRAVVRYLADQRQGTAATKTRGEVAGGGRKPWRQKGTGRARAGSIRSPLWRGGGTIFGPRPRDYRQELPRRMRRLALRQALSARVAGGDLLVIEEPRLEKPRTREVRELLSRVGVTRGALLVTADGNRELYLSSRNLPGVVVSTAAGLNAYQVMAHDKVLLTREALKRLEEVLA